MQVWWWTCRPGLAARVAHGFERAFSMWHAIARRLMLMVFGSIIEPEACQLIVKNHSPLFEQDLVSMLQKKLPRSVSLSWSSRTRRRARNRRRL